MFQEIKDLKHSTAPTALGEACIICCHLLLSNNPMGSRLTYAYRLPVSVSVSQDSTATWSESSVMNATRWRYWTCSTFSAKSPENRVPGKLVTTGPRNSLRQFLGARYSVAPRYSPFWATLFHQQVTEKKLNNYTIQHNETKSIDRHSYIAQTLYVNVNINGATDQQASNVTKSIRTTEKTWTKDYCQSHILREIS